MELRRRFAKAWWAIGATSLPDFDALARRYAEPWRAYHTLRHVEESLGWLDRAAALAERPAEVELAIFYHDAVLQPFGVGNETKSAELFRIGASASGVEDVRAVQRISAMIEATRDHVGGSADTALLGDIDLAILGASPARFAEYEAAIRQEYASVPRPLFDRGRARFRRAILETTQIYQLEFFARRLEAQARDNLGGRGRQS